jgi:hypothetical protein
VSLDALLSLFTELLDVTHLRFHSMARPRELPADIHFSIINQIFIRLNHWPIILMEPTNVKHDAADDAL